MRSFANGTTVSVDKSRCEIEKLLTAIGASSFGCITDIQNCKAMIGFGLRGLQIQMSIPLPSRLDKEIVKNSKGYTFPPEKQQANYDGEVRRRWRCLSLAIKAKIVSIEDGVTTFEREFMPYVVTADGQTVGEKLLPMLEHARATGFIPATLALPEGSSESARTKGGGK